MGDVGWGALEATDWAIFDVDDWGMIVDDRETIWVAERGTLVVAEWEVDVEIDGNGPLDCLDKYIC